MKTATVISETSLPIKRISKGKVRDIYEVDGQLLLIATDRISAFDYVLPDPIPSKGMCLTQLSKFWFDYTKDIAPNQVISTEVAQYPKSLQAYDRELRRPRLPLRLRLELVPKRQYRLRHPTPQGPARVRQVRRAALHSLHQRGIWSRHEHFDRRDEETRRTTDRTAARRLLP